MIRVKDKRKFKLFLIISVILLIVLIWCTIWVNITAAERRAAESLQSNSNTVAVEDEDKGKDTDKDSEPGDNEETDNKQEVEVKPQEDVLEEKPPVIQVPEEKVEPVQPTKPMVVPESVPDGEAFAVFNNTLIIGDSRTEGFKLYSGVKNATYFCMKAMTIDKIVEGKQISVDGKKVSVYDLLGAQTYDKVIVGVGLNELGWNHIETFLGHYGTLIDKIKEKQPTAQIYLQAVLPVTKSRNDTDKVHNNAQIYWYNENIIKLAEEKGVKFVNPAAALTDEQGFIVSDASTDGVHFTSAYCKVWAKYLAELLQK